MIDLKIWRKAWALLDARERRSAFITLAVVITSALSALLMVSSVMPLLYVLTDPSRIETMPQLSWAYHRFHFTSTYNFLVALGIGSVLVILIASLVQITKTYVVARFSMMRMHSLSQKLIAAYLRQPYEFFLDRHSGEMGTRILSECREVVMQFLRPATELVAAAATIFAITGLLVWVEPVVALISFAVLGGLYAGIYLYTRRFLKILGKQRVDANSARYRVITEALGGVKDIKLLGRELSYVERYAVPSQRMARMEVMVQTISSVPQFALQAVALGGVIALCIILLDQDALESGAALGGILPILGLFAFAGQRLMPELSKLFQSLALLQSGGAAVEIVHDDLVDKTRVQEFQPVVQARSGLKRSLKLVSVSYHYPKAQTAGLKDVSLSIQAGEKVGIVGSTGAGKTTLADVILALLRPTTGFLIIDDMPVTDDKVCAWQQSVGYVPQDIFLIDASVAENIALGVPNEEINYHNVEAAAGIAQLDKFIRDELADGYNTNVGERGVRLSGGQRQRIGIARALYHDADLIVFDEATSALDNLTEREVMTAIDALPGDKTVLMIAHRLSTVERCDRIVVLDKGRIVGCDSWDALMEGNETFRRIAAGPEDAGERQKS